MTIRHLESNVRARYSDVARELLQGFVAQIRHQLSESARHVGFLHGRHLILVAFVGEIVVDVCVGRLIA
jgi:hypothetical protein